MLCVLKYGFRWGVFSNVADLEELSSKHQKDFAKMRRSIKPSAFKPLIPIFFIFAAVFFFSSAKLSLDEEQSYRALASELQSSSTPWAKDLVRVEEKSRKWLKKHGIASEVRTYDSIGKMVIKGGIGVSKWDAGFFQSSCVFALKAFQKISFAVIACWRFWIILLMWATIQGCFRIKPYRADDLLGETGNGRVYFSGIRASLDKVDESGSPDELVTGLACLRSVPYQELIKSDLYNVLRKHNVVNDTNNGLAARILYYGDMPAYVAVPGEEDLLAERYEGNTLAANTAAVLDLALTLHAELIANDGKLLSVEKKTKSRIVTNAIKSSLDTSQLPMLRAGETKQKISSAAYIEALRNAFYRVLTPKLKKVLATVEPRALATALLSLEAGKPLGINKAGNSWVRATNFPQLGARAVLHSIPDFPKEYRQAERTMIRQAIIYGWRKSVFGPVQFPVDLNDKSRAIRQWVEIAMACPHEINNVIDDVQLFGLITEVHHNFESALNSAMISEDPKVTKYGVATELGMFFLPLKTVLWLLNQSVDTETKVMIRELVGRVSSWQYKKLQAKQIALADDTLVIPDYERIPRTFTKDEIEDAVNTHGVTAEEMEEWGFLRYVLYHHSWLARRVGDLTVPETCVVFYAIKPRGNFPNKTEEGYIGSSAMVPLRDTHLVDRWGKKWKEKFEIYGHTPYIAMNKVDYEAILHGRPVGVAEKAETMD